MRPDHTEFLRAGIDRPLALRPEFAEALLARLLAELELALEPDQTGCHRRIR